MFEFSISIMKINNIDTSKIMVTRTYKHAKFSRNAALIASCINLKVGLGNAMAQALPSSLISYGCTCFCVKVANDSHAIVKALKPTYESIVKRAKQIYKHK